MATVKERVGENGTNGDAQVTLKQGALRQNTYLCLKSLFLQQGTEGAGEEGKEWKEWLLQTLKGYSDCWFSELVSDSSFVNVITYRLNVIIFFFSLSL